MKRRLILKTNWNLILLGRNWILCLREKRCVYSSLDYVCYTLVWCCNFNNFQRKYVSRYILCFSKEYERKHLKMFLEGATVLTMVFICMGQLQTTQFFQLSVIYLHKTCIQYTFNVLLFLWNKVSLLLEHHFVWPLNISLSTSCWLIWQDRIQRADVSEAYF